MIRAARRARSSRRSACAPGSSLGLVGTAGVCRSPGQHRVSAAGAESALVAGGPTEMVDLGPLGARELTHAQSLCLHLAFRVGAPRAETPVNLACRTCAPKEALMDQSLRSLLIQGKPPMTALTRADEIRVPVESDTDIVAARQKGRALAARLGFSSGEATMVATAISELARNIVLYADRGEITHRSRVELATVRSWSSRPATKARGSPMSGRRCRTATRPRGGSAWACPASNG